MSKGCEVCDVDGGPGLGFVWLDADEQHVTRCACNPPREKRKSVDQVKKELVVTEDDELMGPADDAPRPWYADK